MQPDLCLPVVLGLLACAFCYVHAIQVIPLHQLYLGPTVQITVPSGKVKSEALPTLDEWIDSGAKVEWYKPGAMMQLSAEGLRVSDLPPPAPLLAGGMELELEQDDDALSTAAPGALPILRCLYSETFCHVLDSDTPEQDPSMRRVYSPTLSTGGSLVKNLPEG